MTNITVTEGLKKATRFVGDRVTYKDDPNFSFEVGRERLVLSSGIETNMDAIFRKDTGQAISVVSPKYKLVTHSEANKFVEKLFDKNNIEWEEGHVSVSAGGARFMREFRLPGKAFTPNNGGNISTALDGAGKPDIYYPAVIARNSCDKSSGLEFLFGGFRLVCENGMIIGQDITKISVKHIDYPDYKKIGDLLLDKMEMNIEGFKRNYETLNSIHANPYLNLMLAQHMINNIMAKALVEMSEGLIQAEFNDEGKLSYISASSNLSAYALMQLVTHVISHRSRKYNKAVQAQQKISKLFSR